jgi:hypothetical protein
MAHVKRNGQHCDGRAFQEPATMAIKCQKCREPIGPPPAAGKKPVTIAASANGVNELLNRRLHPEQAKAENPYAAAIQGNTNDAFALIAKKNKERRAEEARVAAEAPFDPAALPAATAVMDAPAAGEEVEGMLTSNDEMTVAPPVLPPSPSADIVADPLEDTPPLMMALQAAAAEGAAAKAAEPPPAAGRRRR